MGREEYERFHQYRATPKPKPVPKHGTLEHQQQFSPDEPVKANDTVSFWQGEGYSTILEFTDKVWLLYVYMAPRQFRMVRTRKSNPAHNYPDSWHYV
jgi:hypothetical protein